MRRGAKRRAARVWQSEGVVTQQRQQHSEQKTRQCFLLCYLAEAPSGGRATLSNLFLLARNGLLCSRFSVPLFHSHFAPGFSLRGELTSLYAPPSLSLLFNDANNYSSPLLRVGLSEQTSTFRGD